MITDTLDEERQRWVYDARVRALEVTIAWQKDTISELNRQLKYAESKRIVRIMKRLHIW